MKQILLDLNLNWRDYKFFGELDPDNMYCKLSDALPWEDLDYVFSSTTSNAGRNPINSRVVLGALIIQHIEGLTDRKLIIKIQENPYYQMFIGMKEWGFKAPFDASSLVHFRKRIEPLTIEINELLLDYFNILNVKDNDGSESLSDEHITHKGDLVIDATAAPVDVRYPTDLKLLDETRIGLELIIDKYYQTGSEDKKPRTNRKVAKQEFNEVSKQKKASAKKRKKAVKKQLTFVKNDIKIIQDRIENKSFVLTEKDVEKFELYKKVYEQQKYMSDNKVNSVENRIISLNQTHVRPIVRGKAGAAVEFGAKVSMHIHEGYAYLDKVSFDSFNEATILKDVIDNFKEVHGYYPKRVLGDRIYQNRENRKYCKELGIRLQGKSAGRKSEDTKQEERRLAILDNSDRQQIEGLFGELKRKYGMDRLFTKLKENQMLNIGMLVIVRNIEKYINSSEYTSSSKQIESIYYVRSYLN